jgi:hypothetical protein
MASTSETGHNKNVINFETLIINCNSFAPSYNPSRTALEVPTMETQLTQAKNSLIALNTTEATYKNVVLARKTSFSILDKLITRVNNSLKASDTPKQTDELVQTIVRKLKGKRATPKKNIEEKKEALNEGKETIEISTSQMSYDSRLDNFDKLIKLLSTIPQYAPNEADLKVSYLTALYNDLKAKNLEVINAELTLSNERISRNDIMYKETTGLVSVASDVKLYFKSLFGASSQQYKQITRLKFINYKN